MIKAINKYPGTLLVVSHNVSFLSQVRLDKGYLIKNSQWKFLPFLMHDTDAMYNYLQQEITS
jgi:ATPase subunit of ABC transporter with duplicated ATPase domains